MTTTAFDDQFTPATQTVEPVRQPYDTVAILRRNIADMEVALRTQTERAEAAEAELAKLREQKPVAWRYQDALGNYRYRGYVPNFDTEYWILKPIPLYAAHVPVPVPAVPEEWRKVMAELTADLQAACDAEHPHRDQYPSVMRRYNNDMEIVEKARALLQSAEVQAVDKWQLTPATTHPVDRKAGEVRHD